MPMYKWRTPTFSFVLLVVWLSGSPPSLLHQLCIWVGLAASVGNFHGTPSFHLLATLAKIKLKHKAAGYARQAAHLQQVEGRTLRQANSH